MIMKWVTSEQLRVIPEEKRKAALREDFERTKDMTLDELYVDLGRSQH